MGMEARPLFSRSDSSHPSRPSHASRFSSGRCAADALAFDSRLKVSIVLAVLAFTCLPALAGPAEANAPTDLRAPSSRNVAAALHTDTPALKAIETEFIRPAGRRNPAGPVESTAGAPVAPKPSGPSDLLWKSLSGLGLVVGLMLVGVFVLKRLTPGGQRSGSEAVTVLGRAFVGPRQSLHLIKIGRRILVLGNTPAGMSSVAEIADPEEVAQILATCQRSRANSITNSFRQIFRREQAGFQEERGAEPAPQADQTEAQTDPAGQDVSVVRQEVDQILDKVRQWRAGGGAEGNRP
jgi:flagellar biogenesis protein FliO